MPPWVRMTIGAARSTWLARGLRALFPYRSVLTLFAYLLAALGVGLLITGSRVALRLAMGLDPIGGALGVGLAFLAAAALLPVPALVAAWLGANSRALVLLAFARKEGDLHAPLPILEATFRPFSLRGRRAFAVHVTVVTDRLSPDDRVGLEVRVRTETGKVLGAELPRYRDEHGAMVVRELSQEVGEPETFTLTLGTMFPVRAVSLAAEVGRPVRLHGEIRLVLHGVEQGRIELPFEFTPREGDLAPRPVVVAPPVEPLGKAATAVPGFEVVATQVGGRGTGCPVCGDPLLDEVYVCGSCEAPHHSECWVFAGRCSTYACEGEPVVPAG